MIDRRTILPVAAFCLLLALLLAPAGLVSAQQNAPATTTPTAMTETDATGPGGYRKLDDMNIVTQDGDKVGEVEEVLIDSSGNAIALGVEVGGFLGISDEEVVIRLDQLRFETDRFVTDLTKEELERLPKWND